MRKDAVDQAYVAGIRAYAASRRERIDDFIERTYSFAGAWDLNRRALGWDIVRAPVNLLWAPAHFFIKAGGTLLGRAGFRGVQARIEKLPAGLRTDVERELEWLIYSGFLELPYESGERKCARNALIEHVLTEPQIAEEFGAALAPLKEMDENAGSRKRLERALDPYLNNRKEVSELATALLAASGGLATSKALTPGAVGLGQAAAATIAHTTAVSNFVMGPALGGIYYSVFPGAAAASTALVVGVTAGVAALLAVISAFAGIVTDPAQKALKLHRRKLMALVDGIEADLLGTEPRAMKFREGVVTRLLDLLDVVSAAARTVM